MSTIKTDTLTSVTSNTDLTLSANGTGGVKVSDYFQLAKGEDISSAGSLTLGKDGNFFDVTGTTTITSIGTQGIGSHITLHFDDALTLTHHATNLILPGADDITTAAGDIAVMYEYASADWRCVSYTTASGVPVAPLTTAVVNAGENIFIVLDGTDSSSTDAGDNVIMDRSAGDHTDAGDDIIGEDEVLLHTGMQRNVFQIFADDGTLKISLAGFAPGVI
jgi:hypothetical protein